MAYAARGPMVQPPTRSVRVQEPVPPRSFVGFLKAVKARDEATLEKVYGTGYSSSPSASVEKTAMGESGGTVGGYIVPPDYTTKLLDVVSEYNFIYPRATIVPMESRQTLAPKIDVETAQAAGTAPYFGGVLFQWGSEQAPKESEPAFRQMQLTAWDLLGYANVSNQWLGDTGPAGEEYLVRLFGRAAGWYMEYAFLSGKGAGNQMPLGVVNAPAALTVSRQTGSTVTGQDIAKMFGALLPFSVGNAVWACGPDVLIPIQQLSNYFVNVELGGLHKVRPTPAGVILTRPVFVTDKLPAIGTRGDLVLFDPTLYTVGMRQEVLIDVSEHVAFATYQTVFRVWLRCDGMPQLSSKVTLSDGTRTASPYVVLV